MNDPIAWFPVNLVPVSITEAYFIYRKSIKISFLFGGQDQKEFSKELIVCAGEIRQNSIHNNRTPYIDNKMGKKELNIGFSNFIKNSRNFKLNDLTHHNINSFMFSFENYNTLYNFFLSFFFFLFTEYTFLNIKEFLEKKPWFQISPIKYSFPKMEIFYKQNECFSFEFEKREDKKDEIAKLNISFKKKNYN